MYVYWRSIPNSYVAMYCGTHNLANFPLAFKYVTDELYRASYSYVAICAYTYVTIHYLLKHDKFHM